MSGTLYGLGVGPGDPDLITLKALKILRAAPVIAYPAPETGDSLARAIVAPHLPGGQTEIAIRIPIHTKRHPAREVYERAATDIAWSYDTPYDEVAELTGYLAFYGDRVDRIVVDQS